MWFVIGFVCGVGATITLMLFAIYLSVRWVADLVMDETDVHKRPRFPCGPGGS